MKIIVAKNYREAGVYIENHDINLREVVVAATVGHLRGYQFSTEDVHYVGDWHERADYEEIRDYLLTYAEKVSEEAAVTETRVTSSTGGEKGSKPQRYSLLPKVALDTITEVFNFGTKKYAPHNYRKGYDWSLSYDALQRHLAAWWDGEENDRESGLSHLGHAGFHVIALIVFSKGTQYKKFDDRYKDPALVDLENADQPQRLEFHEVKKARIQKENQAIYKKAVYETDPPKVEQPPYYMPPFHPSLVSDWSSEDMTVSEDDKGVIQDEQAIEWVKANPSLGVEYAAYPKLESDYPVLNDFFNDVGKLNFPATFEEAVKVIQSVEKPVVCEYKPFWSDAHGEYDLCKTHGYRSKHPKDEGPNRSCLFVDPWTKLEEIDD